MMKKITTAFLIALFSLSFASSAMANCKGGKCSMKHHGGGSGCASCESCGGEKEYQCPIVAKIMKKAHFFMSNAKEIGLTDDQVKAIKAVKMDTKKFYIRQEAEMKVFNIELEQKMSEPKMDVEAMNAMFDQASAGFAKGAKESLAFYVQLKSIIKEDQMAKAKELWMQQESGHSHH